MTSEFTPAKILVIRFSSLGDVILTTALFPNVRAHWPSAEITMLTKAAYATVFANNPFIDHCRVFDPNEQTFSQLIDEIRREKFDLIIDLHGNLRSWMMRFVAGARRVAVVRKRTFARYALLFQKRIFRSLAKSVRERVLETLETLDVPVVSVDTQLFPRPADPVLKSLNIPLTGRLIGVAPGAKHKTKRWLPERFAEAANRLAGNDGTVVIVGDKSDVEAAADVARGVTAPCLNVAGWTSLPDLFAVVSRLSVLLTNDSGIMHAAEAMGVPLVAVFGPTVKAFGFAPYRASSRVAEMETLECRPCSLHGTETCPLSHHRCMHDLTTETVLTAAQDVERAARTPVPAP